MPIPKNKEELLADIASTYAKLKVDLESVPARLATGPLMEGHAKDTFMTVHNLTSYLIGWGELVLKWHKKKSRGEVVDFPETGYKWNELGKLAQKFYKDYKSITYPALLIKLDQVVNQLQELVKACSNKELYGQAWYETWTMGRLIQLNSASPYKNARVRLRKWKKENKLS